MQKFVVTVAAAVLSVSAAHAATQDSPAEATSEAEGQTSTNHIVCQRVPAPTGSRVGARRICRTQAQWDQVNRETRDMAEQAFNRSKMQDNE